MKGTHGWNKGITPRRGGKYAHSQSRESAHKRGGEETPAGSQQKTGNLQGSGSRKGSGSQQNTETSQKIRSPHGHIGKGAHATKRGINLTTLSLFFIGLVVLQAGTQALKGPEKR